MIIELKKNATIAKILKSQGYRKHKAIVAFGSYVFCNNTYWDGGSRSTYVVVNVDGNTISALPQYAPPQFGGPSDPPRVDVKPGYPVIEMGTTYGETKTAVITINPADAELFGIEL